MIELDDEVRERVAAAIDNGNVLTAAYVDSAGKPHISFYGSTHVHGPDELAIWVRSPASALLQTLPDHCLHLWRHFESRVLHLRRPGTGLE